MQRRVALAVTACAWLAAAGLPAHADPLDDSERGPPKGAMSCVHVQTEAPYRAYGYDHLVTIENGCDKPVRCTVKTDVNPEPSHVRVEPQKSETVLTFRGSPASTFKADVSCTFEP